ncbi:MAG TPA: hypothetical protein VFB76_10205 [Candidatus Angelobacter sp.]|nr:hypothetical protein [Candidatus Angelobacter sp.]
MDPNDREAIVDGGIRKGKGTMERMNQQSRKDDRTITDPLGGRIGPEDPGKLEADASNQRGTESSIPAKGEDFPERAGISRKEQDLHERQADPKAAHETFKDAEIDTKVDMDPGEGKPAA